MAKEGAPLLWKNLDEKVNDYRVKYIHHKDDKYGFLVIGTLRESSVVGGVNEVGFGIMGTATHNLPVYEHKGERPKHKYGLRRTALATCKTVDDFERLLKNRKRSSDAQSNVGVADATGAVAYFEIWGDGYARFDVHDSERGYDVRTNFSFAGDNSKRGKSERRYRSVMQQIEGKKSISAQDLMGYSRSFFSADKGDILNSPKAYIDDNYCVPRRSSLAAMVIVCGKEPRMDVIIGHPVAGIVVPLWVKNGYKIPTCVSGLDGMQLGLRFTQKAYIPSGRRKWKLNKPLVKEVLAAETKIKIPAQSPKQINRFNAKIDDRFDQHRAKIDAILSRY